VEILKDGKHAEPGIVGNIVLTDLRNSAMPLIRFQMSDKGVLINEKCNCGRTFSLMKPYAGRSSEYIILPNNEILSPYLFTTGIEKIEGLLQYQILQISERKILAGIVANKKDFNLIADSIKDILSHVTKYLMEIEVQLKTKLDIEENGKFKVVRNLLLEQR
jgi:phenylacetate-CoA ligase